MCKPLLSQCKNLLLNCCNSYNKKTEITNSIKERKDFMISQLQCTQLKDPQLRDTALFSFYSKQRHVP